MSIDPREKVVLFIDGANLYATSKAIGIDIDYRRLLAEFQSKAYLLRAYYYTALVEDQEYSSIRPLIDTGVLTTEMFEDVVGRAAAYISRPS